VVLIDWVAAHFTYERCAHIIVRTGQLDIEPTSSNESAAWVAHWKAMPEMPSDGQRRTGPARNAPATKMPSITCLDREQR
jgi:hypothetical protein